jgi:hypothetical protein
LADLELQKVYRPPAGRAVEAPWGEEVARSVVQKFTTVDDRNAKWTTPPPGAICATVNTDQLWYHNRTTGPAGWEELAQLDRDVGPGGIKLPIAGGTMLGTLNIGSASSAPSFGTWGYVVHRNASDAPYIDFVSKATPAVRFGYIQYNSAGARHFATGPNETFLFYLGAGTTADPYRERFRVEDGGAKVTGVFKTTYQVHSGGDGPQIQVIDTNTATGNADAYIGFYSKGTVDTPGAMGGRIGFIGSGHLTIENLATSASMFLRTPYAIALYCGGIERARVATDGVFAVGRTSTGVYESDPGIDLRPGGQFVATSNSNAVPSWMIHTFNSAADKDGVIFITFRRGTSATATAQLGYISQKGTSDVNYGHGSDYRLKNVVGPIPNGVDRLKQLRPLRARWRTWTDGESPEFDCFLAHEVAEVVPYAVDGEKDEVYPDDHPFDAGEMKIQGLDEHKMVPLIVAALQEVIARVEALEAA